MVKPNRLKSFIIITFCYIAAALWRIWVFQALPTALWLSLLIADLAATFIIWILSQLLNNASVYDPYWSVQLPIILAENHLATYKTGYAAYVQETRQLLPLPKRKL